MIHCPIDGREYKLLKESYEQVTDNKDSYAEHFTYLLTKKDKWPKI